MRLTHAATSGLPQIPTALFIGGFFVSFAAILGFSYIFFQGNWVAIAIVAGGLVLVLLLVGLYLLILKWMQKRKANPLSQGIAGNAAAAPQGISEPARRARLDDLRRNFDQGVEKFRAAGKNLYSVPWLVLVGEPGSGKTEAIRHCNVGFPPGLQDQLQGAGGTLNMNWWFTNQAIILDTAGRLMFEEVVPGSTNEWNEFLKLLKNNRPNSPLNGMLLVIPVDTLIKDTADQIEKKAGKIAQQFDQIQRTLGVRFPVFVIITKCDLLNGFREFFDDLNDPQLQHQMMGWSNPAPLDERFDPATVMNHLETVKTRLVERRKNLLLDPVNTEDPQSRRVDQVDALYALPDSITKIGPRLRRYLEMIFVAGEWSPKPLFLRGIYFTSSMTEGSALDAELAEVLGVPVDSLPEGRVWRRDRAYFLRDLFIEKVFREKGLVTRASNADKQQRTRRLVVMTFSFLAVLLLFGLTWFGARQLSRSIGGHKAFWEEAAKWTDPSQMAIVQQNKYNAEPDIKVGNQVVTRGQLFSDNLKLVQERIHIPVIFRPMTLLGKNVDTGRPEAYRALYETTVLRPAYETARKKIAETDKDKWSPEATAALAELMKLEFAQATNTLPGVAHPQVNLDNLFKFLLPAEEYQKFVKEKQGLQDVADWAYTENAGGTKNWPSKRLTPGTATSLDPIATGINTALVYWKNQAGSASPALSGLNEVAAALDEFEAAEQKLLALKNQPIDQLNVYDGVRTQWVAQMTALRAAADKANRAWTAAAGSKPDVTLTKLYTDEMTASSAKARAAYELLLQCTTEAPPNADVSKQNDSFKALADARTKLVAAKTELDGWQVTNKAKLERLAALDNAYIAQVAGVASALQPRFQVHAALYELADKKFVKAGDASTQITGKVEDAFGATDKEYGEAIGVATGMQTSRSQDDRLFQAGALTKFVIENSARAKKHLIAGFVLNQLPEDPAKWQDTIAEMAKTGSQEGLVRPDVPLVTFDEKTFSPKFSPDAAGMVMDNLLKIRDTITGNDAATRIMDAAALTSATTARQRGFDAYRAAYTAYWRDTVKNELKFGQSKYSDLLTAVSNVSPDTIFERLNNYKDKMASALDRVGAKEDASAVRAPPPFSVEDGRRVMRKWIELGGNPRLARSGILGMSALDFREGYTVMGAAQSNTHAGKYWQGLPVALVRTLASDGRADIEAGLLELARYEKFPLAPASADPKEELTLAEVIAARGALEKVSGAASMAAAPVNPGTPAGARPINQGGLTNNQEMDAQLEVLRGVNLLQGRQEYFDKLGKFLAAMPVDAKPMQVDITVAKDKYVAGVNPVTLRFNYMDVIQKDAAGAEKLLKTASLSSAIVVDKVAMDYPGGEIIFKYRDNPPPGGAILQTDVIPGRWAPFRLLTGPNVKSATREGGKWTVEYLVRGPNNTTTSLFLVLEFKTPVPDVKDWPVPPRRPG